uniref:Putative Erf family protein n=1 Tax=viral metagenome TaxID=1070528 RepID=A0A6M3L365_9ZZZZ
MNAICTELNKIQVALKAPKSQLNKFGGYKYRSCEDILEAVKPLLKNGAIITISDRLTNIGNRYYVCATATFQIGEKKISVDAYAREQDTRKGMDESQITGSASSYARKYALNGLLLIDDTKDADSSSQHEKNGPAESHTINKPPPVDTPARGNGEMPADMMTKPQRDKLFATMTNDKGMNKEQAKLFFNFVLEDGSPTKKWAGDFISNFDKYYNLYQEQMKP